MLLCCAVLVGHAVLLGPSPSQTHSTVSAQLISLEKHDFVFSTGADGAIIVWSPNHEQATPLLVCDAHASFIPALLFVGRDELGGKLWSIANDKAMRLWKVTELND